MDTISGLLGRVFARFRSKEWQVRFREFGFTVNQLRKNKLGIAGFVVTAFYIILALVGPLFVPYNRPVFAEAFQLPNAQHWFGVDAYGWDILSATVLAARVDIAIAFAVVVPGAVIGSLLGGFAAYLGGKVDEVLMRITDIFLAFPALILAMAIAAVLGRSLVNLTIALIVVWWPSYARLLRGQGLVEREKLYVEAARAYGARTVRLVFKYILPNSVYPILVNAALDLGNALLLASSLSFIGFGVPPGSPEWGRIVSDSYPYLYNSPWMIALPAVAIFGASLGFILSGDAIRDALDPRLRR